MAQRGLAFLVKNRMLCHQRGDVDVWIEGNQEREFFGSSSLSHDAECCYNSQEENGLIPSKNHSILEGNATEYFSIKFHNVNREFYRSARSVIYPFYGRQEIRVVELVLVVDGTLLRKYGSDSRKIEAKFLEILSYVNFLYFQFHLRVALVGIDYWFYGDKFKISKDADFNLRSFNVYRKNELLKKFKYDHALLLSGIEFGSELGVVLGRAYTNTICGEDSTSVMSDNDNIPKLAWTIAHEMGHSFGMRHDDSTCYCRPGQICIMATHFSGFFSSWSSCSRELMNTFLRSERSACLKNIPTITYSYCGNYVLDPGEECDCGLPEYCLNSCCDSRTCRLKGHASCANGECCNQKTCTLKPKRTVCRRKTSECDLPEVCDGYSEFCPPNKYQPDGKPCRNGQVFCVKGICPPPLYQQCRLIWGEELGSIEYGCYKANSRRELGSRRRPVGYCNYYLDHRRNVTVYEQCNDEDVYCGVLLCTTKDDNARPIVRLKDSWRFIESDGDRIYHCRGTQTSGQVDRGLVRDGTKCGKGKMCLDHRCIDVGNVPKSCHENCFDHGKCNDGNCICYPGYELPYCEKRKEGTKRILPVSKFSTTIKSRTSNPRSRAKRPRFTTLIFMKTSATRTRAYTTTTTPTTIVGLSTTMWTPNQKQATTDSPQQTGVIDDETDDSGFPGSWIAVIILVLLSVSTTFVIHIYYKLNPQQKSLHNRWFREKCRKLNLRPEMLPDFLPQTTGTDQNLNNDATKPPKRRSFFVILSDGTVLHTPGQEKTVDISCDPNSKVEFVNPHLKEATKSNKAVSDE